MRRGVPVDDLWKEAGACYGTMHPAFFPDADNPVGSALEAKLICDECPVKVECGEYALTERIPFGIFGGMTANDRRNVRRDRNRRAS